MDLVLCDLCFAPVHSGEQHRCFFFKSDEDIYSIPNPNESEEKGKMLEEVNSGNINDGSLTIYSNFGEKKVYADLEVFSQTAKNNEQISLLPGSTRKTKYPAYFAGDFNNTCSLSSCDNLSLDSTMIIQECRLNRRENNFTSKSSCGSENTFESPTTLTNPGFLADKQNLDEFEAPRNLLDASIATRADTGSISSNLNVKFDFKQSQEFMKNMSAVAAVSAIRSSLKNPAKKRKPDSDLCSKKLKNEAGPVNYEAKRAREKRFECNTCQKRFSSKQNLDTHRRTHTGEKPYECGHCDRRFSQQTSRDQHRRTHTGEKPYECEYCESRFSHKGSRDRHRRTHTGEKPYECEYCESRFSHKVSRDQHRLTHTGEKPYGCDYCDRRFNRKSHLQNHRFTHTGEKPYGCDHCDRRFSQKANRDSHHRRVHTGEKLFKCEICKKDFAVRSNLRRRAAEAHTQEKPFKCGAYGMAFETNHLRNQHRKENH